jgi:hypothetical protein
MFLENELLNVPNLYTLSIYKTKMAKLFLTSVNYKSSFVEERLVL